MPEARDYHEAVDARHAKSNTHLQVGQFGVTRAPNIPMDNASTQFDKIRYPPDPQAPKRVGTMIKYLGAISGLPLYPLGGPIQSLSSPINLGLASPLPWDRLRLTFPYGSVLPCNISGPGPRK